MFYSSIALQIEHFLIDEGKSCISVSYKLMDYQTVYYQIVLLQ